MRKKLVISILSVSVILMFCSGIASAKLINSVIGKQEQKKVSTPVTVKSDIKYPLNTNIRQIKLMNDISSKYKAVKPSQWGEKVTGVISRIDTQAKVLALTFDACGGNKGDRYDEKLISYLIKEKIPATLFLNARWIDANMATFRMLAANPLFEIENHGYLHKPLSVSGKSAYKIKGTANIDEVVNEVYLNEQKIFKLTGRMPKYFRSGTAFYDNVAVDIVKDLGEVPVDFNIIGDAGATFSVKQIQQVCLPAKSGSIIIFHMNQPKGSTAEGIMKIIPLLRNKGFTFVHLEDYNAQLK